MPHKYSNVGDKPQHLYGDARTLYWFRDNVLDYVYSSHLLEDYPDPYPILQEWLRVLKVSGILVLNLPNELRYRETCKKTGQPYNMNHQCVEMSLNYMKKFFSMHFLNVREVFSYEPPNEYSFLIIVKKLT